MAPPRRPHQLMDKLFVQNLEWVLDDTFQLCTVGRSNAQMPYQRDSKLFPPTTDEFPSVTQDALGNAMTGPYRFINFDAKTSTISLLRGKADHQGLSSCSPGSILHGYMKADHHSALFIHHTVNCRTPKHMVSVEL